jgi:hypothetical protein
MEECSVRSLCLAGPECKPGRFVLSTGMSQCFKGSERIAAFGKTRKDCRVQKISSS